MSGRASSLAATAGSVLAAWAVIMACVLGVGWLLTGPLESTVDPWDDSVARWLADHRSDALGTVADVGTLLGDTPVGMGVAAVAAVALALWRRSWRPVVFMGLAAAGIGAFYSVATHLITRDRPPVRILDPGLVPDHSFPSGHVATATVAYAGTFVVLWVLVPAARRWAWLLLLLPLLEVFARLYEGAHHVTDTLTSLAYASAWLLVLARVVLLADHRTGDREADREVSSAR
jgi:undecaprenyl-diphosphatase